MILSDFHSVSVPATSQSIVVADMAAEMDLHMVADMEVNKVANMVADMFADIVAQFCERVSHGG